MKVHLVIAAAAVALSSSVALAGGYKGNKHIGAPQFANAVALNYSKQIVTSKTLFSKGKIDQTAGATAKAVNESKCGCKGVQLSNAFAKNNSLQVATWWLARISAASRRRRLQAPRRRTSANNVA